MDYKKKYEELVGKVEKAYLFAQTDNTKAVLEEIRPILKEIEDERIKNVIYGWIYIQPSQFFDNGFSKEEMLAWLEKQGDQKPTLPKWRYKKDNTPLLRDSLILNKYGCVVKSPSGALVSDVWVIDYDELAKLPKEEFEKQSDQPQGKTALEAAKEEKVDNQNCAKPADKVEPKFHEGDIIKPKDSGREPWQIIQVDMFDKKYRFKNGCVIHFSQEDDYELVEQKPAEWSEEDEKNLQGILDEIEANKSEAPEYDIDTYNRFVDWLKSIKDRVGCEANCTTTWKPSDEQIHWLKWAINIMPDTEIANEAEAVLEDLFEQLKKL